MYSEMNFTKSWRSRIAHVVMGLASLALLLSCQKMGVVHYPEHKKLSEAALEQFHKEYNAQQFELIYEASSPILKKQLENKVFVAGFREVFLKFGRVIESTDVATACFPLEIRSVRYTKYEKGAASEMFIWSIGQGQAQLALYKLTPGKPDAPTAPYRGCDGTSAVVVLPGP